MKIEANLFNLLIPFFIVIAVIYGFMTDWNEWVGFTCLILTAGLVFMVGVYLSLVARRIDPRPSDDPEGEIAQGAGPYGFFSPWSWWPIVLAGAASICFRGVAIGWWIFGVGAVLGVIALVGWVFEYSRGIHSH
jgi:hypothetical protein